MKKIFYILTLILVFIPSITFAAFTVPWTATSSDIGFITPTAVNGNVPFIQIPYLVSTLTNLSSFAGKVGVGTTTPTGGVHIYQLGDGTDVTLDLDTTAANLKRRSIKFATDNKNRFIVTVDSNAESGTLAGSVFGIDDYDNTGAFDNVPFAINRATGGMYLQGSKSGTQVLIGTNTQVGSELTVNNFGNTYAALFNGGNVGVGTTTPGSLFSIGTSGTGINFFDNATSTFSQGINIAKGGCFAVGGSCIGAGSFTNTIANGGTGSTSFAPNSIITSNAAGTALIATGTQLSFGNFLATSTTGTSQIGGALFAGVPAIAGLGTSNSQLQISQNINNLARQLDLANTNMGANAEGGITFENGNSTNAGASSAYIAGLVMGGPNFATAGFGGLAPNGLALFNTDGRVDIGATSANAASSTVNFYSGNAGSFAGGQPDLTLTGGSANLGLGTTSPGARFGIMGLAGGSIPLVLVSSSTAASATSTVFTLDKNGVLTLSSFGTTTANNGFNITAGCFSIAGTCLSTGGSGGMSIGGAVTSGTAGSILFVDGSGNLGQDNANLFRNTTNGRIGLGTTTPNAFLSIQSSPTNLMALFTASTTGEQTFEIDGGTGFGGFGTTTPWGRLSVNPNALAAGTPAFVVGSSSATSFIVANNGNVGVATTSPTSPLSVERDNNLTTISDGILLSNTTLSTSGVVQQNSPALHFNARGWKTNATAADQAVDFTETLVPRSKGTNVMAQLEFIPTLAGTAGNGLSFCSGGAAAVGSGTYLVGLDGVGTYNCDNSVGFAGFGPVGAGNVFGAWSNGGLIQNFTPNGLIEGSAKTLLWSSATSPTNTTTGDVGLGRGSANTLVVNSGGTSLTPTGNITAKFIGLASSTPFSNLSIDVASSTAGTPITNAIGIGVNMTIAGTQYLTNSNDEYGHQITGGPKPTITPCGTAPSVFGDDMSGIAYLGTGIGLNSCTINFANPIQQGATVTACFVQQVSGTIQQPEVSTTTTGFVINGASMAGLIYNYSCAISHN